MPEKLMLHCDEKKLYCLDSIETQYDPLDEVFIKVERKERIK